MKSDCNHVWVEGVVKGQAPVFTEICMWCGIPKVRTSAPRPVMKCPPRKTEPYWVDRKTRGLRK